MRLVRAGAVLVLAVTLGAGASGCGLLDKKVDKAEVEEQASAALKKQVGQEPKDITCPEDLEAKKGAKLRCKLLTPDDEKYGVTVTVDKVDGSDVSFKVLVDSKAKSQPKSAESAEPKG